MKNRFVNIFIVFFFSGTIANLFFRLLDFTIFRSSDFKMQDWSYGNIATLGFAIIMTYIWINKNKN
ncbi:MAG: hypothetical protein O3A48_04410 [Actinomycetota bacterium]|nr:hypothetical protein [Actinomycetota bacterium]MDA3013762.1 hypothetical protein [Actinomycetota bacterium]